MQWKQLWNMPGEGSMWMLRHAGKWLQDAGKMELEQWTGDFASRSTVHEANGDMDITSIPVDMNENLIQIDLH